MAALVVVTVSPASGMSDKEGRLAIFPGGSGELLGEQTQLAADVVAKAIAKRVDSSFELIVEVHGGGRRGEISIRQVQ